MSSYAGFVDPMHGRFPLEYSEAFKRDDAEFKAENFKGILPGEIVIMIAERRSIKRDALVTHDGMYLRQPDLIVGCSTVYFPPTGNKLRSLFDDTLIGIAPQDLQHWLRRAPESGGVVGERIHLNLETKTGRISDPLGDQTPIAQEWRKFLADLPFRVERLHGNSLGIAQKDQVFDLNIEDGSLVDTWHYWMSRFVEGSPAVQQRFAILLQGSLSPSDDLARGGRVLINKATMAGSIIDSRKFRDGPILSPPNPISDARVREFEGLIATGI